ncbi:hypothetical protein GCM10028857_18130 [Salinarchaeum chitinilyticum]
MNRRSALQAAGTATLAIAAGCTARFVEGENETLEIRNEYETSVTLDVSIENDDGSTVFDESITIRANETVTRDVLGDDQFYLDVTWDEQRHEFGTRPICDDSFTRIIVTEDGTLDSEIEDCE